MAFYFCPICRRIHEEPKNKWAWKKVGLELLELYCDDCVESTALIDAISKILLRADVRYMILKEAQRIKEERFNAKIA